MGNSNGSTGGGHGAAAMAGGAPSAGSRGHRSKGVTYAADGSIADCLFCNIAAGTMPGGAPLWYSDPLVSVFVPRGPEAHLHLLVVPKAHVRNLDTLDASHSSLLQHMHKVALQLLRYHAESAVGGNVRCAPPPTGYPYPTNSLDDDVGDAASLRKRLDERRFAFAFHTPPFNSIDHLHLHAFYTPFRSAFHKLAFAASTPWCTHFVDALALVSVRQAAARTDRHANGGATQPMAPCVAEGAAATAAATGASDAGTDAPRLRE